MTDKKPKGKLSAFNVFVQEIRSEHKKNHSNEIVSFGEMSKRCGQKWKEMSEEFKQRFRDIAEEDAVRYEREMQNYVPTDGAKKRKAPKDPNRPKRPPTAFFVFSAEMRATVKSENPEFKVTDVARELGKRWREMEDKSKYEKLSKEAAEKSKAAKNDEPAEKVAKKDENIQEDEEDDE